MVLVCLNTRLTNVLCFFIIVHIPVYLLSFTGGRSCCESHVAPTRTEERTCDDSKSSGVVGAVELLVVQ